MTATASIRPYQASDWPALWPILHATFQAGETYSFAPDSSEEEILRAWIEAPEATFVLRNPEGRIAGTYFIKPNQPGLGAHVCNCGYVVAPEGQGQGYASAMCEHSQQQAIAMGFVAMQFNLVVSTNVRAVQLWQRLGFDVVGTLPRAFRHRKLGLVDAFVMYKTLAARGIGTRTTASLIADRRSRFRSLHASGCFVLPNPWDVGSARYLQSLGFQALATTSSGFAWSRGQPDAGVTRDTAVAHLRELVEATDLPVNADFENGYAHDPHSVAENVRIAVETGVAGLSIEDATGDAAHPLYDIDVAVARLRAARQAIDRCGGDTLLVARAECFLVGRPDLDETIARLKAYADAGADCLYAPGVTTREQIAALVAAVAPKPLNLLVGSASELTVQDIAALGVRRISVGGALARSAWGGFMQAATVLAEQGRFDGFAGAASGAALDAFFRTDRAARQGE